MGQFKKWVFVKPSYFTYLLYWQVLVSQDIAWKYAHDGNIPPQAMVVGHTDSGENLYLGRAYHEGTITPGKVSCIVK